MNWGTKIAIVFAGFVVLIASLVTICVQQDDIHLVTEKYYEKEIAYQDQIDIEKNTAALKEKPAIVYAVKEQTITFSYPGHFRKENVDGSILFFRPSDARKDFTVKVKADADNRQQISASELDKGLWTIKMEWNDAENKYYIEKRLIVQ